MSMTGSVTIDRLDGGVMDFLNRHGAELCPKGSEVSLTSALKIARLQLYKEAISLWAISLL
jgi:hypothetical protein